MSTDTVTDAPDRNNSTDSGDGQEDRSERSPMVERLHILGMRLGLLVVLVGVWAALSGRVIRTFWISSPGDVYHQIVAWSNSGRLWTDIKITLQETVEGFVLGAVLGMVVGVLLGWWRRTAEVVNPFIIAVNSIPKLALAPLLILWLGIGTRMKVVLAGLLVFFLVFYNTYAGVREVSRELVDTARLMGAKRRTLFRFVVLPSAMTMVLAGLRVSVPYAFLGAVVGEMLASNSGIGYLIMNSSSQFNTAGVFAGLVLLMVMASVINALVGVLEKRLLRWREPNVRG